MPIRVVDNVGRVGRIQSSLSTLSSVFAGTHVAPPGRTGTLAAPLGTLGGQMQGVFTPSASRSGVMAASFQALGGSITGTFTAGSVYNPDYPRFASYALGGTQNPSVAAMAECHVNVVAYYPGWENSRGTLQAKIAAVKAASTIGSMVVPYTITVDALDSWATPPQAMWEWYNQLTANQWFVYTNGLAHTGKVVGSATGWSKPNYTTACPLVAGDNAARWKARWDYKLLYTGGVFSNGQGNLTVTACNLTDGKYDDNLFARERSAGDYNVDGVSEAVASAANISLIQSSHAANLAYWKTLAPAGSVALANCADWPIWYPGGLTGLAIDQIYDGGVLESIDEWINGFRSSNASDLMRSIKVCQDGFRGPKLGILEIQVTSATDYAQLRYWHCVAALTGTYYYPHVSSGYLAEELGTINYDERRFALGAALPDSTGVPQWTPRYQSGANGTGIYRRDFANGIVLWAAPGATYSAQSLGGTFHRLLGSLDAATNNGQSLTTVTLTGGTGLVLARVTQDTIAPSAPTSLVASATSTSAINLTWTASIDTGGSGMQGYRVERSTNGTTGWSEIAQPTATSYSDTALPASTQYFYRVRARDVAGNLGAYSATANATTQSLPVAGAPVILGLDIISGPMGGAGTTGDEGGQGTFLRIYLTDPGAFSDYGVTAPQSRVTIGGQIVGNYRYLRVAPSGDIYSPNIYELCVQVGALGALTNGVNYPVVVTTSVGASNSNFVFKPNPGRMYWLNAGAAGSNSNPGTQASPFKDPQTVDSGGNINGGAITSDKCVPGTTYVFRGGTTYQSTGKDGCCWRLFRMGGNAPTGALGSGYCHFTGYPGPAGGNAPEDVYVYRPNGAQSLMAGNDSARGDEVAPYAGGKFGQYWSISGFRCDLHPGAQDGVVTLGTAADFARVVGNYMGPWLANVYSKAAGVAGNGGFVYIGFNYIHDLNSPTSETHGVYADGSNTGAGGSVKFISHDWEVCYNKIRNILGGSGLQCYGNGADGAVYMTNMNFHHNDIGNVSKYGINMSLNFKSGTIWCNVIRDSVAESMRIEASGTQIQAVFAHNVCYNPRASYSGGGNCALTNDYALTTAGSYVEWLNNIVILGAGRSNNSMGWLNIGTDSVGAMQPRGNLYFDAKGVLTTKFAADSLGLYANPLLAAAYTDFHIQPGSPANNAGAASTHGFASSIDFDGKARPKAGNAKPSIGAYEVAP
jgi:hypothetical protein